MVHLAIHLPYERKVAGLVSYSWMNPIERSLHTLKEFVQNKARPEGYISEAYLMKESDTFLFTLPKWDWDLIYRDEWNDDNISDDEVIGEFKNFKQKVKPLGASSVQTLL